MLFVSLVLYLAAIYIRPGEIVSGWEAVPFVQIITGIASVVAVLALLLSPRRLPFLPQDKCVVAFYAVAIISNLTWGWFYGAYFAMYQLSSVVFCYFLIRVTVRTDRQFTAVVSVILLLTLFQALNGIVQYQTGIGLGNVSVLQARTSDTSGEDDNFQGPARIRGTGIFNDPNDLALLLVVAVPFALARMLRPSGQIRDHVLGLTALLPILCAIYYTNSRGGVLGLGAVLVSYAYQNYSKRLALLMAALGIVALAVLGPSRVTEIDAGEDSAQGRIQAWSAGLEMLKQRPLFGVGYSRFTEFNERVAHNSFVHTFAELGIVGGATFMGMFYFFFKNLRSDQPSNDRSAVIAKQWAAALRSSGIGFIACACFLSRQYNVVPYIVLALGACRYTMATGYRDSNNGSLGDWGKILGLTMAGIASTYVVVRFLAVWSLK